MKTQTRLLRAASSIPPAISGPTSSILPRSAAEPDDELVCAAVVAIGAILERTVQRGAEEVGDYVLKTFYCDDSELYASSEPRKHASLRKLVSQCGTKELPVSATFLANAVRLAALSRQLAADNPFRRLPVSHRVELLRLPTPEAITNLAREAAQEEGMTVRRLRQLVRERIPRSERRRGRPSTPPVLRAARKVAALLRADGGTPAFEPRDLSDLSADERRELARLLRRVTASLAKLERLL